MAIVLSHATGREPPRHEIGEVLLGRAAAAWEKRDAPGNKAGDTDTSEARQTDTTELN
jgi:hypothetical protein